MPPLVRRVLSETLPEAVAAAAYEFITGPLLADPHRIGKRLLPPMDDRFRARRGTYRVIYRIDDKARVVTVVDVTGTPATSHPNLSIAQFPLCRINLVYFYQGGAAQRRRTSLNRSAFLRSGYLCLVPGFRRGVCLLSRPGGVPGVPGWTPAPTAPAGPPFVPLGWFVLVSRVRAGRRAAASRSGTPPSRASPG